MKKIITTTIAAGLVATAAHAGVSATADLVSAYVYRGGTLDDNANFQPGIEVGDFGMPAEYGSISAGIWGSYSFDTEQYGETDYYVSYGLPSLVDGLDLSVGYCHYSYAVESEKEVGIAAGYEVAGIGLGVSGNFMIDGLTDGQVYVDFSAGYDIEVSEELGVSLGAVLGCYVSQADGSTADDGFGHLDLSASTSYALSDMWSVSAFVTYIQEIDDAVLETDVNFLGGIGVSYEM
jgi:hypothetical protein